MRLLLLDLDDTLVDRAAIFAGWLAEFATDHRLDEPDHRWITALDDRGRTDRTVFFGSLTERFALTGAVASRVDRWQTEFPARYRCAPGVLPAMRTAREQGWRLGVVTNGDAQVQQRKLRAAGLLEHLDAVCISGAESIRKPDPRLFALAAERAGAPLSGGWMIGDNPTADIRGARDAGLSTVWISGGDVWPELDFAPTQTAVEITHGIEVILSLPPVG